MSEVNANDSRIINNCDDVIDTYQGAKENAMTGLEVELAYFDAKTPNLDPMTIPQNKVVKNATNTQCKGEFARNEPTSEMLEVGSNPGTQNDLKTIINDTNEKIACLSQKAADIGLKRSYFQDLPNQTAKDLLKNIVPVERYQAFFAPPRDDMQAIAAYFSVCKSNQVSISYRDTNHLFDNIRRLYALTPVLFMLTDNGSGFDEGIAFKGHAGMKHRAALKEKGGCPDYLFTAKNGDDYIKSHIDAVMHNPLFVYYDQEGNLVRLPSGTWESFHSLKNKGLNTATNYYFSESILWPDVKIAALKNAQDEVINHRYEARMFGVGIHQHVSALLIVAGLAFNDNFADKTDHLLKQFELDWGNIETTQRHIHAAYKNARNHDGKFLDIPFGSTQMIDFTKKFADLLEEAYLSSDLEDALSPILSIARTGRTDAKVNRKMFTSLEETIAFQRNYDANIFDNTNQCAHMIFEKELNKICANQSDKQVPCS
ncbi:MAG: hypothetical protein AB8B83_03030 [Bdellovibrionales bacterium]